MTMNPFAMLSGKKSSKKSEKKNKAASTQEENPVILSLPTAFPFLPKEMAPWGDADVEFDSEEWVDYDIDVPMENSETNKLIEDVEEVRTSIRACFFILKN